MHYARQVDQTAARLCPDDFDIQNALGNAYLFAHKYPQALLSYDTALKFNNKSAFVHFY